MDSRMIPAVTTADCALKGRAQEIYTDIAREIEALPGGYTLPSVRELQQRYRAGQQTILHVLDELDRRRLIQRFRRKGVRVAPGHEVRTERPETSSLPETTTSYRHISTTPQRRQTTQVRMLRTHIPIWETVAEKFNRQFPDRKISITGCDSVQELTSLAPDDPADMILLPNHPRLLNPGCNTWQFMDLRELLRAIDRNLFYDTLAVAEPRGRVIGIAPSLGITLLHCRASQCLPAPPTAWNWDDFITYGHMLRQRNPRLEYACFLDGYIYYLFHSGQSLIDMGTGRLRFDYDELALPLERLKRMVHEHLVPIFSDMYEHEAQYSLFRERRLAILEQASGWSNAEEDCILRTMPLDGAGGVLASEQFSIRATSMRYESCWEFIKFTLSEEIQAHLATVQRCFPVRKGIFSPSTGPAERTMFEHYLSRGSRRREDFHFPPAVRYVLEAGIDQWLKLGGDLRGILQNLEQSCQSQIDDMNRYFDR